MSVLTQQEMENLRDMWADDGHNMVDLIKAAEQAIVAKIAAQVPVFYAPLHRIDELMQDKCGYGYLPVHKKPIEDGSGIALYHLPPVPTPPPQVSSLMKLPKVRKLPEANTSPVVDFLKHCEG